jgi:hypothetical protein
LLERERERAKRAKEREVARARSERKRRRLLGRERERSERKRRRLLARYSCPLRSHKKRRCSGARPLLLLAPLAQEKEVLGCSPATRSRGRVSYRPN